jgi:hypothetical protein
MSDKLLRLQKLIRFLIFKEKLSYEAMQKNIAEKLDSEKSVVSRALNGDEKYLTDNFIVKLNAAYGDEFNNDWLMTGKGEMLNIQNLENANNSIAIGRDANGSEIHITSQNVDEFLQITEKYQEQTDRMLVIIEKLINK